MKHTVGLFCSLALLWWVLSGHTGVLLLSLGLASALFTLFIAHRMNVIDEESQPLHLSFRLAAFWLHLLKEIVVSNVQMVKLILSPRLDIDPRVVTTSTALQTDLGQVLLGNAITLTPGTVTLDVSEGMIEVHAINGLTARDVESGAMERIVPASGNADRAGTTGAQN